MFKTHHLLVFFLSFSGSLAFADALGIQNQTRFLTLVDSLNASSQDTLSKIEMLSASLLGVQYVDGGLGEGENGKYDKDPLSRFDEFDCTTYVETILAGAMSHSASEFLPNLTKIRYHNGQISFVTRNHFPSADWLLNNHWFLKDVTSEVAGKETLIAKTTIDKKAWYQSMTMDRIQSVSASDKEKATLLASLREEGKAFKPEPVSTPYVPLSAVFIEHASGNLVINQTLLDRIPSGSIISMVRPDYNVKKWIGTNMNVTHQSIAIRKKGTLFLRHASQLKKEVTDEDFVEYFSRYIKSPSLKGFNVQAVRF